jgi:hypothetical protein
MSIRLGEQLLISNSIVFLLVQADDRPDMSYPFYVNDLVRLHQTGFSKKPKQIHTEKGSTISFHFSCNFLVNSDLSLFRQEKNVPKSPKNFEEYFELLDKALKAVTQNASDPLRENLYEPLTTISRGYDSTASSVFARRAGCKEAVTFAKIDPRGKAPDDNGKSIGERLGLKVIEYNPHDFIRLPGFPEAEFTACSNGMDVAMSVMENQLTGKLLMTGRPGELIWNNWRVKILFSRLESTNLYGPAFSLNEFRLRVGFLRCPILHLTSRDIRSIHQITRSREMKPWSIGGSYDRPIARRIVESAGIPRPWFGKNKVASAYTHIWRTGNMTKKSRDDFLDFYKTKIPPMSVILWLKYIYRYVSYFLNQAVSMYFRRITGFLKLPWYVLPDTFRLSKYLFTFHWGFFKIRDRYKIDPTTTSSPREN